MSKKEDDAYKEWIDEIRSKLPDEAKVNLDALVNHDATRELFRGGIREAHLYTKLNELNEAKKAHQTDVQRHLEWFNGEKPKNELLVKEVQRLQHKLKEAGVEGDDVDTRVDLPKKGVDNSELEQLRQRLTTMDKALPSVIGQSMAIAARIIKEGYDISPDQVFQHAAAQGVDLNTAFQTLTKDEREKREAKSLEDKLKKAREEGARDALAKLSTPDRGMRPSGPSVVDTINAKDNGVITDKRQRVDAAVQDFMNLQQSGSTS